MIDKYTKQEIDEATYDRLLTRWRWGPVDDSIFEGEMGIYYAKTMARKKRVLSIEKKIHIDILVGRPEQ